MLIFFSIIILLNLLIYIFLKVQRPTLFALLFKIFTALSILILAIYATYSLQNDQLFGFVIVSGLIFGLLGDIFLDLKLIYHRDDKFYTFAGYYSFLLGHLIYIAYFFYRFELSIFEYSLVFALAGIVVFLVLTTENVMKLNYGPFRIITSIYAFVLAFLMFISSWIGFQFSSISISVFGVGIVLFAISDLILSQIYFGRKEKNWLIICNYIFYFGAQYLIAFSLFLK